jgi:hypothetical protein
VFLLLYPEHELAAFSPHSRARDLRGRAEVVTFGTQREPQRIEIWTAPFGFGS